MTRGTPSLGKRHQKTHNMCRRCGNMTYHIQKMQCASCGFPAARTRKFTGWGTKVQRRRGTGSGRMRTLKHVARKAKNNFRTGTTAKPKERKTK